MARQSMRDKIKKRADERESSGGGGFLHHPDGIDYYNYKKGTKRLRIVPYEVTVDTNPEMPAGELWYQRTVWVHYSVGVEEKTITCPLKTFGKPCPICEERAKLLKDPDIEEEVTKDMLPKERECFNVLEDGGDEPKLLTCSYHVFGKKLEEEIREGDEAWGDFAMLEGGYELSVRWGEKKLGKNTFLEATRIDFHQDEDLPEEMLDEVYDLDAIIAQMSYDQISDIFFQGTSEEEEKPSRGSRGSGRSKRGSKDEEEKPSRGSRRGSRESSKDEEEEKPNRGSRRGSRRSSRDEEEEKPSRGSRRSSRSSSKNEEEEKPSRGSSRRSSRRSTQKDEEEEKPSRGSRRSSRRSSKEEEKPKRGSGRRGSSKSNDEQCPYDYEFGLDCNANDECDECGLWKKCQQAFDGAQ